MIELTFENFDKEVCQYPGKYCVLFTAPWVTISLPTFELLSKEKDTKVGTVNFDVERELVHKFSIRVLPYILVFNNGIITQAISQVNSVNKG